mmetsp:Transcript_84379/g.243526  ORF Transcript_84379/g.243526 Transcript_84379/m.243526 type:complete len:341 (-) Transcript_84379:505-1527(-)
MFDAKLAARARRAVSGHVASSKQARRRCLEAFVGDKRAIPRFFHTGDEFSIGNDPDAGHDNVAFETFAAFHVHRQRLPGLGDLRNDRTAHETHALALEKIPEYFAHLLAEHTLKWYCLHAQYSDVTTPSLQCSSDLHPDERRAHDDDGFALGAFCRDLLGVLRCAQLQNTWEVSTRDRQLAGRGPSRDHGAIVGHLFTVGKANDLVGRVQRSNFFATGHFDVKGLEVCQIAQGNAVGLGALGNVLRQHGSIIRQMPLLRDQDNPPGVTLLPKRIRCSDARSTATDHEKSAAVARISTHHCRRFKVFHGLWDLNHNVAILYADGIGRDCLQTGATHRLAST